MLTKDTPSLAQVQQSSAKKREQGITRDEALGIAARIWADPAFSHAIMDPDACARIADILVEVSDSQKIGGVEWTDQPQLKPRSLGWTSMIGYAVMRRFISASSKKDGKESG